MNDKEGDKTTYDSQVMRKTQSRLHQSLDKMDKKMKRLEFENNELKKELQTLQQ